MPTSPDRWCTSSVYWVQVISWMLILCRIQYKSLSPEAFSHDGFNTFNTSRWFEQSKECLLDVTWTDMPGYSTTWHDETSHHLSKSSTNLQMGLRCWWRPSIFQESEHLTLFICPHLASSHVSSEWTIAIYSLFLPASRDAFACVKCSHWAAALQHQCGPLSVEELEQLAPSPGFG
jgi:hypothetical protein